MAGITSAISGGLKRISIGWIGNTILAFLILKYGFMYALNKLYPLGFYNGGGNGGNGGGVEIPPELDVDLNGDGVTVSERLRRLRRLRRMRSANGGVVYGSATWYGWVAAAVVSFVIAIILMFTSTFLLSEPYISWMKGIMGVSTKNLGFNGMNFY